MKRTMNWIAALVVGAGVLALPAMAHDRDRYRDNFQTSSIDTYRDNGYGYGREWRGHNFRERNFGARYGYHRIEHRNWDCR